MKLGSNVRTLASCRDNFGVNHNPGQQGRVVAVNTERVQIEFPDRCVFKRGRATLLVAQVEAL